MHLPEDSPSQWPYLQISLHFCFDVDEGDGEGEGEGEGDDEEGDDEVNPFPLATVLNFCDLCSCDMWFLVVCAEAVVGCCFFGA